MICGQNSARCFMLTVCSLQIVSTALRQIFDFMGFMWLPIIANFFNFIFVIFGFFGSYQYKPKYILIYVIWLVAWVGWNMFVTCFYLNVGILDNRQDWLNFGTGSAPWLEVNGPGCKAVYPSNFTGADPHRPLRPERVEGCVLDYVYVETIHAAIQCLLAIMGVAVSLYLLAVLTQEDDTCKTKMRATSIYSVEFSPNTEDSGDSIDLNDSTGTAATHAFQYTTAATLTPRRVKRHHRHRSSSRTPQHPTPQTNFANNYTASGNSNGTLSSAGGMLRTSSPVNMPPPITSINSTIPSISGQVSQQQTRPHGSGRNSHRRSGRHSGRRRPQYVNPVTQLMDAAVSGAGADSSTSTDSQQVVSGGIGAAGRLGHSNPMYVHSRPGSLHSLVSEAPVERPPSVHSSYSNYHGVRAALRTQQQNGSSSDNQQPAPAIPPAAAAGLPFARSGKGLRGSQNSILGGGGGPEQRRTALTSSEIRVPPNPNNLNINISGAPIAVSSSLNSSTSPTPTSPPNSPPYSQPPPPHFSGGGSGGVFGVTSVTNISPSSVISSSHNTTQSSAALYQQIRLPPQQQHFNNSNFRNINNYNPQQHQQQQYNPNNQQFNNIAPNYNNNQQHQYNLPPPPHQHSSNVLPPHSQQQQYNIPPAVSPPYNSPYNSDPSEDLPPPYTGRPI